MTRDELLRLIDQTADEGWTSLDLSNKGLTELPPEIGKLKTLKKLNLRYNQLTNFPAQIGALTELELLDVKYNQITSIPSDINSLVKLTTFYLVNNRLQTLPPEIGKLINLISLSLINNELIEIPNEIGMLMNLKGLDLRGNKLTKLPSEIGNLSNLTWFGAVDNQITSLPSEIGELVNLTSLSLKFNKITIIPDELCKLKNLIKLDLSYNQIKKLPRNMIELENLQRLFLKKNLLPIPSPIIELSFEPKKIISYYLQSGINIMKNSQMEGFDVNAIDRDPFQIIEQAFKNNVTTLDLSNKNLTQLPLGLCELKNLHELDLRHNQLTSLPPEIENLSKLERLDLRYNQLGYISTEICNLKNLTNLYLSNNKLRSIPSEIKKLTNLKKLGLEGNQLSELPSEIGELSNLTGLGLIDNQLSVLPPEIGKLKNLDWLALEGNKLCNLPEEIEKLTNLHSLYLEGNRISEFPHGVEKLKSLINLSLEDNQICSLPSKITQLTKLEWLNLRNNLLEIPLEILELENDPQKILNYYFQHVAKPKKPINEAKVIVVGQGGVGKTSLVKRLLEDEFNPYETKTDGIAIKHWHVKLDEADIRLNLWDFGGQEIMHATHQFFLTKRSLYLLVLDSRLDEQENRVEYWLKMIQSFGGDSPIVVVCNKCDEHDLELNWKGLQDKYPTIRAFARQVSCKTGAGIADLRSLIEQEAGQLPHIHDELILSWFAVKTALEEMQDDYISYSRYRQICAEQAVDDELSQKTLLGFLHDLGIVLHFHDHPMLEDTNVLNPEWVTRGVYQLLNSNELFQSKGELERSALDRILDPHSYPRAKHQFILDMMRKFELCFDFAEYAGQRFLVPDLLSKEEPYTGDWEESLGFQYHYDILPGSVMSRFIVRMHAYIFKKTYWRHGVTLVSTDGKNKALVKADIEERKIFIQVAGRESTRHVFLEIIRADFHKIHRTIPKLKVKEKVPIPGHPEIVTDYEHLLTLEELGEDYLIPEGLKKKVSVRQLLHGIQPQPTPGPSLRQAQDTAQEGSLPHTYFLSYSWKNSGEADHLELALSRQQRTVLRDETNIEAGGRVSTSVESMIQQADTFVALWNEHYAHSDWCPNELTYARTRQARGEKPARIVLVALDQTDVPIRFIDTLRLTGQDRDQRELAIQRLIREEP